MEVPRHGSHGNNSRGSTAFGAEKRNAGPRHRHGCGHRHKNGQEDHHHKEHFSSFHAEEVKKEDREKSEDPLMDTAFQFKYTSSTPETIVMENEWGMNEANGERSESDSDSNQDSSLSLAERQTLNGGE